MNASARRRLVAWLRAPLDDTAAALEALVGGARPRIGLALLAAAVTAAWFVYVPIHELLHVAGCLATGGRVTELELDPVYGAALLARWLPFVVPGGDHAGRLSGFDTGGSDAVYLATDAAPYLLSVWPGVALLRLCARRPRPLVLGAATVLALAPFYNAAGDYYEMGSILAGRIAGGSARFAALRSDDLPRLLGALVSEPASLGLASPGAVAAGAGLVALGLALSLLLAFLTYAAGRALSR